LFADLKDVVPEFTGEFGVSNLPLLRGLLEFASYKTEQARLQVRRAARDGIDYVAEWNSPTPMAATHGSDDQSTYDR